MIVPRPREQTYELVTSELASDSLVVSDFEISRGSESQCWGAMTRKTWRLPRFKSEDFAFFTHSKIKETLERQLNEEQPMGFG